MAQKQDTKAEQTDHPTASTTDALHPAQRRPVTRPPVCGREALKGYAVGATVGCTLALAYFLTRRAWASFTSVDL